MLARNYHRPAPCAERQCMLPCHNHVILILRYHCVNAYSSKGFPHQNPASISVLSNTCHIPRPSHPPRADLLQTTVDTICTTWLDTEKFCILPTSCILGCLWQCHNEYPLFQGFAFVSEMQCVFMRYVLTL